MIKHTELQYLSSDDVLHLLKDQGVVMAIKTPTAMYCTLGWCLPSPIPPPSHLAGIVSKFIQKNSVLVAATIANVMDITPITASPRQDAHIVLPIIRRRTSWPPHHPVLHATKSMK